MALIETFKINSLRRYLSDSVMPLGILVIVAMMVLPLPTFLLDVFFSFNILLALLVLMIAIHSFRPLDFSSFPTLLLVATVLRLALNVASTRIVLANGHTGTDAAGQVIEAFGSFVIAGNFVVGIFVFAILVIINLVVITKGAGRVSEVTARFTLDSMPGKQMAIDADLNAGILTPEEATERRNEVAREADFYGSMDGASKFVKGDAVAGILILAINILGGITIGVAQYSLSLGEAASLYTILSIGDGLVAQIPSLLLSIGTAIIVTRVSSSESMSDHIGGQLSIPQAWYPVAVVIGIMGLVPGMPSVLFLSLAAITGTIGFMISRYAGRAEAPDMIDSFADDEYEEDNSTVSTEQITDNSRISVVLSYPLIALVEDEVNGPLVTRIAGVRKDISKSLGFVIPSVRIKDDLNLEPNFYQIKIGQRIVAEDKVYPGRLLTIPTGDSEIALEGEKVIEPTFGLEAYWITEQQRTLAEARGYVVVEPEAVITTQLSKVIEQNAHELIGQDELKQVIDRLAEASPSLVESVVPKLVPLHNLTAIMKKLLEEQIPINDMRKILEVLAELSGRNMSIDDTAEALRPYLIPLLLQRMVPHKDAIPVITLDPEFENLLINADRQNQQSDLIIDGKLSQNMIQKLSSVVDDQMAESKTPFLIVAPVIRKKLSKLVRAHLSDLNILSFTELPESKKVEVIATVSGAEQN
ncbi:flagellar biosynthesis protein FlhA [Rhodobacteraceae bacterium]|nr:flagellar biosynthesis protein FlhA [Paracoccaceae bacterium]MDA8647688.1 flagellar biosynthesis protein FlhA [Paracoccaceae bacterium]MDA9854818.1 flagellar biosynthesis protein FlhA [Paracoccaceae bacterium]